MTRKAKMYQMRICLQKLSDNPPHHLKPLDKGKDFSAPAQAFKYVFKRKRKREISHDSESLETNVTSDKKTYDRIW
jgi:hypothetical protein